MLVRKSAGFHRQRKRDAGEQILECILSASPPSASLVPSTFRGLRQNAFALTEFIS